jgi:nitroreductase
MIPCLEGRPDRAEAGMQASYWGSLLPAVWSFMLALRSRGLGSAWTTLHLLGDGERKAAELLGIPFERYTQGGLFPIAYTKVTDFKKAQRLPAEQLAHWDTW